MELKNPRSSIFVYGLFGADSQERSTILWLQLQSATPDHQLSTLFPLRLKVGLVDLFDVKPFFIHLYNIHHRVKETPADIDFFDGT